MKIRTMERKEFYTWLHVELDSADSYLEINKWCRDTGCGKLVKSRTFSFKNDEEITMFCMRWVNK